MTEPQPNAAADAPGAWARILAEIAHDLRGAAGGAELWLELLARTSDEASRERARLELRRALGRSVLLAEDLADAATALAGVPVAANLPFDVGVALGAAHLRIAPEARIRGIEVRLELPADFQRRLAGDEGAWGRALDRILAAALVHVPAGAPWVLRAATTPAGGAEISIPCGDLRLPSIRPLLEAWGEPRPAGAAFPLGLWLARERLASAGCRLEIRGEAGDTRLVIFTP